jgi:hypothetical protein
MKLKLDAAGNVVLADGRPMYVHDDGKEVAYDVASMLETIKRRNNEAKENRERAAAAEEALKRFEGIDDPDAARQALEAAKAGDGKGKGRVAEDFERARADLQRSYEAKLADIAAAKAKLETDLMRERLKSAFGESDFIKKKMIPPPDMVQAQFGSHFKIEGDSVIAYDEAGNRMLSRARPGEPAGFDEAIEMIVNNYPKKDAIIRGAQVDAPNVRPGTANGSAQGRTITRAEFDNMTHIERQEAFHSGAKVV